MATGYWLLATGYWLLSQQLPVGRMKQSQIIADYRHHRLTGHRNRVAADSRLASAGLGCAPISMSSGSAAGTTPVNCHGTTSLANVSSRLVRNHLRPSLNQPRRTSTTQRRDLSHRHRPDALSPTHHRLPDPPHRRSPQQTLTLSAAGSATSSARSSSSSSPAKNTAQIAS
jgi:hypothetical protein